MSPGDCEDHAEGAPCTLTTPAKAVWIHVELKNTNDSPLVFVDIKSKDGTTLKKSTPIV